MTGMRSTTSRNSNRDRHHHSQERRPSETTLAGGTADLSRRLLAMNAMLDHLDGHLGMLMGFSSTSFIKIDKKLDDLSFRLRSMADCASDGAREALAEDSAPQEFPMEGAVTEFALNGGRLPSSLTERDRLPTSLTESGCSSRGKGGSSSSLEEAATAHAKMGQGEKARVITWEDAVSEAAQLGSPAPLPAPLPPRRPSLRDSFTPELPTIWASGESTPLPAGYRLALGTPGRDTTGKSSPTKPPPEPVAPSEDAFVPYDTSFECGAVAMPETQMPGLPEMSISHPCRRRTPTSWSVKKKHAASMSSFSSMADLQVKAAARAGGLGACWSFLDDPDSSVAAMVFAAAMPYIILSSVILALMQTATPPVFAGSHATILNVCFESIFLAELVLRCVSCPSKKALLHDYNNLIDFIVLVPLFIRMVLGSTPTEGTTCGDLCMVLMCVTPLLRALKTLRRFETLPLLVEAFLRASEGLPACIFVLFLIVLFFGPLLYIIEPRDNIQSVGQAMWLTIVTMTTVGYGDVTPITITGSLLVSVLVILSVLYMAMPVGIVGHAFAEVWSDRDFILLSYRTKAKFASWGYAPHDVPALFSIFAEDGSGELQLSEFKAMLTEMRIGLKDTKIIDLFEALDEDGGGSIDDREFVKRVFPDAFQALYERKGFLAKPSVSRSRPVSQAYSEGHENNMRDSESRVTTSSL